MIGRPTILPEAKIVEVLRLSGQGFGPTYIARKAGVPYAAARYYCERDLAHVGFHAAGLDQPSCLEKADALRLMAEIPEDTRSLTARICGDPLPGRGAAR